MNELEHILFTKIDHECERNGSFCGTLDNQLTSIVLTFFLLI